MYRREQQSSETSPTTEPATDPTPTATTESDDGSDRAIERATIFLNRGALDAAVRAVYVAIQEQYKDEGSTVTHTELRDSAQSLATGERDAPEAVVNTYERVAFAPGSTTEQMARTALDAATQVIESSPPDDHAD